MKSTGTAYLLWFFLGFLGAHKFYLDKVGMGILYLFTFGFFGLGLFIDLFTLGSQVSEYNRRLQAYSNNNVNTNANNVIINNAKEDNLTDQLIRLNHLKEQGILTEIEFSQQKSKLLNS